jgi:hypothetical protein
VTADAQRNGKALLVVLIDVDPAFEEDFNHWYENEHFPERIGLPGFVSARRFVSYEGGPKYLALYDLESVDALTTPEYLALVSPPSEWTRRVESHFTSRLRAVYTDITPL